MTTIEVGIMYDNIVKGTIIMSTPLPVGVEAGGQAPSC